jgi:hypothetical protein
MSAWADARPLPWLYPYREDAQSHSTRRAGEGWHSDGLILLGSIGFLDRFTITASRFAQAVAVEDRDAFDERFGPPSAPEL